VVDGFAKNFFVEIKAMKLHSLLSDEKEETEFQKYPIPKS